MSEQTGSRTDSGLIKRLQLDPQSVDWEAFVRRYEPRILSWCRQRGFKEGDARDVTQEVYVKLLRGLSKYDREKGKFRPWLKRVAHNAWIDYVKEKGPVKPSGGTDIKELLEGIPDPDPLSPELDRWFEHDLLEEAMKQVESEVKPDTWSIFRLLTFEQRPAAEVAVQFGKSIAVVWQTKSRVQSRIRKAMRALGWSEAEGE